MILPANLKPSVLRRTALPARFRRPRVLLVGCGDIGLRVARLLRPAAGGAVNLPQRPGLLALSSSPSRRTLLHAGGLRVLAGDLDAAASLRRLAGLATHVLHLAPPAASPAQASDDKRTLHLLQALRRGRLPQAVVYVSTSGVYGDCAGAWVTETRTPQPATARGQRRLHAEGRLRALGRASGVRVSLLRVPGIYAPERVSPATLERLQRGAPVLRAQEDVYVNHIHADDLARACLRALWRGRAQRVYHVSDDGQMLLGDYFDCLADAYGLERPPRVARSVAAGLLPASLLSFMGESRRLSNQRLRQELGLRLRYASVHQGFMKMG